MKYEKLTEEIIRICYKAYNSLGYGFLEKIYHRALKIEFDLSGFTAESETPITVFYQEENIGDFFADFLIKEKVILEIKAVKTLKKEHEAQLLNYLNASEIEVGLLFNFGPEPEIK